MSKKPVIWNKFNSTGYRSYQPLHKLQVILEGLIFALKTDFSFTYKLLISLLILGASWWYKSYLDFLLIVVTTGLVLAIELMNSAIEALCDLVDPSYNLKIKQIKDLAAAAAGIAILAWVVVIGLEVIDLFSNF